MLHYCTHIYRNDNKNNLDNNSGSDSVIMIVVVMTMSMMMMTTTMTTMTTAMMMMMILPSIVQKRYIYVIVFGLFHFPYVWIIFSKTNLILKIPHLHLNNYHRNNFATSPSITTAPGRKELAIPIFVTGLAFYGPGIIDTVVIVGNPSLMASAGVWNCIT